MAYPGYTGCGPRKLGTTPAKHTTKRNGDPVNAGHLSRHEKGTAHKTIGQAIGTAVNKVKETANVVKTKVKKVIPHFLFPRAKDQKHQTLSTSRHS